MGRRRWLPRRKLFGPGDIPTLFRGGPGCAASTRDVSDSQASLDLAGARSVGNGLHCRHRVALRLQLSVLLCRSPASPRRAGRERTRESRGLVCLAAAGRSRSGLRHGLLLALDIAWTTIAVGIGFGCGRRPAFCWDADAATGLHAGVSLLAEDLVRHRVHVEAHVWWVGTLGAVLSVAALRLIIEMRACLTAVAATLVAGGAYATSASLQTGILRLDGGLLDAMAQSTCSLTATLCSAGAVLCYARYVYRDAQGELRRRPRLPRGKQTAAQVDSRCTTQREATVPQHPRRLCTRPGNAAESAGAGGRPRACGLQRG